MSDEPAEIFDDLYLGLRAGGALRKQRRGEALTTEEQEALGRWQRLSPWRKAIAIGGFAVGTFGLGFTVDWQTALGAGIAVLALRQLEDLLVAPRVLGHAVGLSPLVILVSVTAIGILLGGFYVLLAIPLTAVLSTIVDVVLRGADPAEEDVPPLLFPAQDTE